ncbi:MULTISPECIES: 2'-5' RNA ligase family protein [Halorussus]|uniref:2'-5' RNA ligase family protein n=1 Tax=Halorussus TaxID=1070314 RepID=UPI00209DB1F2|nr:2'-5' RNA ligase family protein [Halorussus vallis]USZ74011.1 2'-5' RNA ligase family protein [Halorussus vallis]
MYSLNVPVPGEVERLAEALRPQLFGFDSIRERHTLLCKRLGDAPAGGVARLREQVRTALAGAPAFEVRLAGIDCFEYPTRGEGPVVYLAVESPGLYAVHERLLDEFPPVEEMEGDDYTPHVTLARGGDVAAARRLAEREVEPVAWTASRLALWDSKYEEEVASFSLPA